MDSKLSLKTEVTSEQLLDAIRMIHGLSMEKIKELFAVTLNFYGKDSLIEFVINKYSAKEIVYIMTLWRELRVFNKNDVVMNYASRNCFVITHIDDNNITLIGIDGRMSKHFVSGFDKWFTKTGKKMELEQMLGDALRDSEG